MTVRQRTYRSLSLVPLSAVGGGPANAPLAAAASFTDSICAPGVLIASSLLLILLLLLLATVLIVQMRRLKNATSCFSQALNSRHHVLYRLNVLKGGYDYLSPCFEQITGHPVEEFRKVTLDRLRDEYFHPEDRERVFAFLAGEFAKRSGPTVTLDLEYRLKKRDGSYCWLHDSSTACFDAAGRLEHFYGSAHDVTGSRRAEHELGQYYTLFMTSEDLMCMADPLGAFLKVNPVCSEILGYSPAELVSRPFLEFVHPDDREATVEEMHRQMKIGHSLRFENRYVCKDGSLRWLSWSAVHDPSDGITYATARDITDRKEGEEERRLLERQLLHTQKLESLGVLAGGIAHDFNNILTGIIGNADLALMRLPDGSAVRENLERIEKAAGRAAELANQMLAYSGKGRFVVEAVDLGALVEELGPMIQVSLSKKAEFVYRLGRPLPPIDADATQIRQVVMNLVINASEALGEEGGRIEIRTGSRSCDERYLQGPWLSERIPEGEYVFLEVADSGCGMPPEVLAKVFDPFFTTKFTGRGLGMSAVLGIVRGHRGTIKVESKPGGGSTFTVLFPAGERRPPETGEGRLPEAWRGEGKVLVVDDEEVVRAICTEMVEALGFTPLTAADGREALEIYRAAGDISLVILDLTMPRMDGEECFRELRRLDPAARVILSSGFSQTEVTRKFAGQGLAGFVQKPYRLPELRETIRKVFS
ncbi:PAS domain-containing protein [Geomonas sp. Red32]|uniref:PAS domain-containing hybrid sensor histidine kinase/response regulator n=1 Tax=Geomonas sp. Red32 TaxID=2912856 RepID=UPI00202D0336|nr:PAS domain-containing sensor histidine kinase [Geomonas sp. Red32]MCM0082943.1 PAS domain-containing protein [Geomonas sp. Red32]